MIDISKAEKAFIDSLPRILNCNEIFCFAKIFVKQMRRIFAEIEYCQIYSNIENFNESILDELAVCFKIDWYDTSESIDIKRNKIKNCLKIYRYKGTVYAVETAINAVYKSEVKEWYEYAGEPYHFKINIDADIAISEERITKILEQVNYYKNARSYIDGIDINVNQYGNVYVGALPQINSHITIKSKE